ncbi:hypothetical protein CHLRE_05g240950v5 [Chlamydomonas reinhardtii]|uniref:Uncharacterized protein n=1 Tax=Chlamydomonas reinhardtii TaxID=3055 RepID=A0A2K3DT73_CHLRE|nr:uncharacterized protein CHLRE_05g240950v5 [Chlamydomonas reinhardtii]PNW83731.1 hypothetical protein CHLRE_05g240950v5 [Chlamydomonas reinhardtii]
MQSAADSASAFYDVQERIDSTFLEALLQSEARHELRAKCRAKLCGFICRFELRVFCRMRSLTLYKDALAKGAELLRFPSDALALLELMADADKSWNAVGFRDAVLTPGNEAVRGAWNEAVVAKGMLPEELAALQLLKCSIPVGDEDSPCGHIGTSPAEALDELESGRLLMPEEDAHLKEPLFKLLGLLAAPPAAAAPAATAGARPGPWPRQ